MAVRSMWFLLSITWVLNGVHVFADFENGQQQPVNSDAGSAAPQSAGGRSRTMLQIPPSPPPPRVLAPPPLPPGYPSFVPGYPTVTGIEPTTATLRAKSTESTTMSYGCLPTTDLNRTFSTVELTFQIYTDSYWANTAGKRGSLTVDSSAAEHHASLTELVPGTAYRCSSILKDSSSNFGYVTESMFTTPTPSPTATPTSLSPTVSPTASPTPDLTLSYLTTFHTLDYADFTNFTQRAYWDDFEAAYIVETARVAKIPESAVFVVNITAGSVVVTTQVTFIGLDEKSSFFALLEDDPSSVYNELDDKYGPSSCSFLLSVVNETSSSANGLRPLGNADSGVTALVVLVGCLCFILLL